MKKWEYLLAFIDYADGWRVRFVQGTELRDWKKNRLSDVLNRLGDEGWELVAVAPQAIGMGETSYFQYIFKCPKVE